jgi:hypothetical protein
MEPQGMHNARRNTGDIIVVRAERSVTPVARGGNPGTAVSSKRAEIREESQERRGCGLSTPHAGSPGGSLHDEKPDGPVMP